MKKTRQRKIESCCHETVLRCWFMVCNMQARPHQGLLPHPCFCHLPSGLPHRPPACAACPKTCLLFILPKFSHVFPILHAFPWPILTLMLVYMGAEGFTLPDFQETIQLYMPIHALGSASWWLFGFPVPLTSLVFAAPCLNSTVV